MDFQRSATIFLVVLIVINSIECGAHDEEPHHFSLEANPHFCNFFDTINITGGIKNSDDSITFGKVRYAKENYATFNYTYLPNQIKLDVSPHQRGCICKYTNCVRMCCPRGHSFYNTVINKRNKYTCAHNPDLNLLSVKLLHEGEIQERDLMNNANITLVSEKPCKTGYFLDPSDPLDEWKILSNGTIMIGEDNDPLLENHYGYCLAHVFDEITGNFDIKAMLCSEDEPAQPKMFGLLIYPAVMLVSVVFLSLTLFVYTWIEELRRTIHGKNLMCYLAMLIVGYSFLAFTHIDNSHALYGPTKCLIVAEIIHTAFLGGFVWLSIISYDIWRTIGRTDNHRNQFFKYCLFAGGVTLLIVLITNILDHVHILEEKYRPGLGTTVCWLQDSKFSHFLYLYSIIIIVLTINAVLFLLTKIKIDHVKRISDRATNSEGSRKFSREETDADRFGLFLRLFIIMGLPWIIEIISWLLDMQNEIIYILDIVTMLQGPIIFFLFIKKRRVKKLIKRKMSTISFRSNPQSRNSGSAIHSASGMTTISSTSIKLDEMKTTPKKL